MSDPACPPLGQLADDQDELDGCMCDHEHHLAAYVPLVRDEDLESYLISEGGE